MTPTEALAFSIVGGAMAFFAWGRFRYDVIAVIALLIGVVTGVVPAQRAFSGFTSDVVVIIACALVISAAVARSGVIEQLLQPLLSRVKRSATQVPVMAGATALLSMPTKNVGALAILMPVAIRLARTTKTSRSALLMPMSFMALLGGLVTLVGTSTNIIASQVRETSLGKPFQMFDFAPVGLALTALGLVFVSFAWRLLPRDRPGGAVIGEALDAPYATEAVLPPAWPESLATLGDLNLGDAGVRVTALVREGKESAAPRPTRRLHGGDTLVLEGPQEGLNAIFTRTPLVHKVADTRAEKQEAKEEVRAIEAVVQRDSALIGRSAEQVRLQTHFGVQLLAVGRAGARITQQLAQVRVRAGDVLILQAGEKVLPQALRALGLLPLIERDVQVQGARRRFLPILILTAAMVLVAFKLLPVAIAFFAAAALMVVVGSISMREAYGALDAQVLILIGALTPLSEALQHSGGAGLVAGGLADLLHALPPLIILATLMVIAMACSPFLHNAPTVLVLAPIGVALATRLHLNPDAFLMAVATGAGADFLTPIGHQCNTLVMGPGGYRFGDYARLGAPLSVLVILVGAPLIAVVWGLGR
ncbi:MAG TPA: SLC13 family permease [Caulobacteraceae bacterium]|nr:SLC13 family permease [Caulobacteraceae bacterium]